MKKTFIAPTAKVQEMEGQATLLTGSTIGVSNEQVGGSYSSPIQAGAKQASASTTYSFDI